jgi:hypothetical protein
MQVLRALRNAAMHDVWLSPSEIADGISVATNGPAMKVNSITSAIRRLRTQGFVINHVKRLGRIREYALRKDTGAL